MKDEKGKFTKGNQFYKLRSTDGVPKMYQPGELLQKAKDYFVEVEENPIKLKRFKGDKEAPIKPRPMSIRGFCVFAGMTTKTFYSYAKQSDFSNITELITESIEAYQLDHASIGVFKENIVARMVGLADKKEHNVSVEQITGMEIK